MQQTDDVIQEDLLALNSRRFEACLEAYDTEEHLREELRRRRVEATFIERERAAISAQAKTAPRDPDAFVAWFENLERTGPGQRDPLFAWLAEEAPMAAMRWFLRQEVAGEAGFDDLVALTQVKLPIGPKLEMARNFWDELGRGHPSAMHGPMLDRLAADLDVGGVHEQVWEAVAVGNLLSALAANRHWAYQSLGALGVVELTAPGRAAQINRGLRRLGVPGASRRYFAVHATLDLKHAAAWTREVLHPLLVADPRVGPLFAEGALMRLNAGARAFARYRAILWESPGSCVRAAG